MSSLSQSAKTDRGGRPEHAWTIKDRPTMAIGEQPTGAGGVPVLFSPWEAEQRVEALQEFDVEAVGSGVWMKQHESLEQLNLQAHQSAQVAGDEFVVEALITFDRLRVLVHELLVIEAWRLHVFPRIKRGLAEKSCSMRGYFCLFHEATLVNLLAVTLHHAHATDALGETAVELVDYLARRLVELNVRGRDWASRGADVADARALARAQAGAASAAAPAGGGGGPAEVKAKAEAAMAAAVAEAKATGEAAEAQSALAALEEQAVDVLVQVSVGCATILRYVCEHLNSLPLSVLVRALETHDILCSLVPILENPPWTRRLKVSGQWQKLVDNSWVDVAPADLLTLTKTEGQVWLALFSLVGNPEVRKRYHFNTFRKGQLLRARKYMNEVLLDQLPVLADVQRFMDELALADVPQPTAEQGGSSVLRFEQVGAVQDKLNAKRRDWDATARAAMGPAGFGAQTDATDKDLQRLVDSVYGLDGVDDVLSAEAEAVKREAYSQNLASLFVCCLSTAGHAELARVPYCLGLDPKTGRVSAPKAVATPHGPFVRRRWCVDKTLLAKEATMAAAETAAAGAAAGAEVADGKSEGGGPPKRPARPPGESGADVPFSKPGDGAAVDAVMAALAKQEEGAANAGGRTFPPPPPGSSPPSSATNSKPPDLAAAMAASGAFDLDRDALPVDALGASEGPALPVVFKAELTFAGPSPVTVAVASEPIEFPSSDNEAGPGGPFPRKFWVQLGAVKDKIAIQVQLVRPSKDLPYRVADAFVSAPAPPEL